MAGLPVGGGRRRIGPRRSRPARCTCTAERRGRPRRQGRQGGGGCRGGATPGLEIEAARRGGGAVPKEPKGCKHPYKVIMFCVARNRRPGACAAQRPFATLRAALQARARARTRAPAGSGGGVGPDAAVAGCLHAPCRHGRRHSKFWLAPAPAVGAVGMATACPGQWSGGGPPWPSAPISGWGRADFQRGPSIRARFDLGPPNHSGRVGMGEGGGKRVSRGGGGGGKGPHSAFNARPYQHGFVEDCSGPAPRRAAPRPPPHPPSTHRWRRLWPSRQARHHAGQAPSNPTRPAAMRRDPPRPAATRRNRRGDPRDRVTAQASRRRGEKMLPCDPLRGGTIPRYAPLAGAAAAAAAAGAAASAASAAWAVSAAAPLPSWASGSSLPSWPPSWPPS
jgi:hypothetical protein